MVDKKPHAYRTIGEAAKAVGVPTHVLRFWETKFSQIRPMKKGGGRRYYRPEDVSLLSGIRVFLYDQDYAIKDLQQLLRNDGVAQVMAAGDIDEAPQVATTTQPVKSPNENTDRHITAEPGGTQRDDMLRSALLKLQRAQSKLSSTLKNQ